MRRKLAIMRLSIAALLFCLPLLACAQDMYKCKDAKGKITYTNHPCENVGLQSAGEVKGQISVTPMVKPAEPSSGQPVEAQPAAAPAPTPAPNAGGDADSQGANARRCFKTAGGIRCNEVPTGGDTPEVKQ